MNRREEALNTLLAGAWEEYTSALEEGTVLELEGTYKSFISGIVDDVVKSPELPTGRS